MAGSAPSAVLSRAVISGAALIPSSAGATVLHFRDTLVDEYGANVVEAAAKDLPRDLRRELEEVTAIGWAPAALVPALADAVAKRVHEHPDQLLDRVARAAMERSFRSVFRAFLNHSDDEALLARMPVIYARLRDTGQLAARRLGEHHAELRLTGWPGIDERQAHLLALAFETFAEVVGRKRPLCRCEVTDDGALFRLTWS